MLDKIFHVVDGDVLLDRKSLLENTDQQFLDLVAAQIGEAPIQHLRMNGNRKQAFLYFKCRGVDYGFAYDREQLIFNKFEGRSWRFIVGWLHVS